jgi:hypothetical protein
MGSRSAAFAFALGAFALAGPGPSRAATVVYDVSGLSELRTRTAFAPDPPGYEAAPFAAGSTLTLELDANDDGSAGDVTIAASEFLLRGRIEVGVLGFLKVDAIGSLTGGLGTLTGSAIEWIEPASYSVDGTFQCFGIICGHTAVPEAVPIPYETLFTLMDAAPVDEVSLGFWPFDPTGGFEFVPLLDCGGSLCNPLGMDVARNRSTGEWAQALWLSGVPVPEPSSALLVAGALLAVGLRSGRRSGTMRRHEAH